MHQLYFRDNLHIPRDSFSAEDANTINFDPAFDSKRDYHLLFESSKGHTQPIPSNP